jgi:hypothetical protein
MAREIVAASRRDRHEQDPDEAMSVVRGRIHGQDVSGHIQSQRQKVMMDWIQQIRTGFAGTVIRRTHRSIDNTGEKLFGLPPCIEIQHLLELYRHEYDNMEVIADSMTSKDAITGTRFVDGGVSLSISFLLFH